MNEQAVYSRRALELRAAEYYASIRKPESEWKSIEDLGPQLAEFEHRVQAGDYERACRTLDSMDEAYLYRWGYYNRVIWLRQQLLEPLGKTTLLAANMTHMGDAYRNLGEVEQARELYTKALTLSQSTTDYKLTCRILGALGLVDRQLGNIDSALDFHKRALDIAQQYEYRELECFQLGGRGLAYYAIGKFRPAIELHHQALAIAGEIHNRMEQGGQTGYIGINHQHLGEITQAIQYYTAALEIAQQIGDRRRECVWYNHLGMAHYAQNQLGEAATLSHKAAKIARELGYRRGESHCWLNLGRVSAKQGNYVEARCCHEKARALNIPETIHHANLALAIVLLHLSDSCAVEAFERAINLCQAKLSSTTRLYGARYTLATALIGQAVCDSRWSDPTQRADLLAPALTEYRRALDITSAPGVVRDAVRDLELIRAAGVEGLEPVLTLLAGVLNGADRQPEHRPARHTQDT